MAKARKLKSGSWNVQVYEGTDSSGKRLWRSITAPTKKEAEYLAAKYKMDHAPAVKRANMTLGECLDKYIELSEEALSPTSIRSYRFIRANAFQDLMQEKVHLLTSEKIQQAVNREARRTNGKTGKVIAPKTVRSEWGLVSSALKAICSLSFTVKLPASPKPVKEYPDPELVIAAIQGTDIELPALLAIWLSFTMSEIRGLTCSSVHDGCIFIRLVKVSVGAEEITKPTAKTDTRLRKHVLPPYLLSLINNTTAYQNYAQTGADGPLVPLTRNVIYKHWRKIAAYNGWDMSFHDLRHMSASVMLLLGVPEKYAMERGGWKTPHVMKSVYQHTFTEGRLIADQKINTFFEAVLMQNSEQNSE